MENASNEKSAQSSGAGEGRKSTPYQRIVIACPENHIIVVKRFSNGGKEILRLSVNEYNDSTLNGLFVFVTEVRVEGGRLVAVEDKKGR